MAERTKAAVLPQRRRRPKRDTQPAGNGEGAGERYHLRVINRALDVLDSFTDERPEMSLTEIAQLVALPESSLFRILATLEGHGYLVQQRDGAYCLPPRLIFGRAQQQAERVREAARRHLESLAHRFDETVSLAYLFGEHIKAIDTVETFHEIRVINKPGRVLPPHCSSLGKAITAFQERGFIDRILECYGLYRRTEKTMVDRQAVMDEFEKIRRLGYSVDREETVVGGICIGAPITAGESRVSAALSVSSPLVRMTPQREAEIIAAVRQTARRAALDLRKR